ncbi:class II glutamine amidotransferase [Actinomadura sp. 9N407]|uniref:class II glutamine amidotransferase n=1 Tax=Actinomadura sp. 9N407 TaxID=3375154 RepID=UPI0037949D57
MFGLLRSPLADHPGRASDAFVVLGMLAEERGRDSAGIALLSDGECRVAKARGGFSAIWRPDLLEPLDASPLALGHTRWATQGSPYELTNASPLLVSGAAGTIVATHNGDIEAGALRELHALPRPTGTTDSEPIFQLLAARSTTAEIAEALASLVGRAALAWADRARPGRVRLARAALSPLTVAIDTERNLYWGSNPRWFREIEQHTAVRFATVVMLREGTYLEAGLVQGHPHVLARASFTPTARAWDMDDRVWTGFTPADRDRDQATLHHRVAPSPSDLVPTAA